MDLDIKNNGVIVRAGEKLLVPVTVRGKPRPFITWTIEEKKPEGERVEILDEGELSIVSIKKAQREDSGKYAISACNPSGIKNAWCRVDVVGE